MERIENVASAIVQEEEREVVVGATDIVLEEEVPVREKVTENVPTLDVLNNDGSDCVCCGETPCEAEEELMVAEEDASVGFEAFSPQYDGDPKSTMEDQDGNEPVVGDDDCTEEAAKTVGLSEDKETPTFGEKLKTALRIVGAGAAVGAAGLKRGVSAFKNFTDTVRAKAKPYVDAIRGSIKEVGTRKEVEGGLASLLLQPGATLTAEQYLGCVKALVFRSINCAYYNLKVVGRLPNGCYQIEVRFANFNPFVVNAYCALDAAVIVLKAYEGDEAVIRALEDLFNVEMIASKVDKKKGVIKVDGLSFENYTDVFLHLLRFGKW